jgi:hypothetical protein
MLVTNRQRSLVNIPVLFIIWFNIAPGGLLCQSPLAKEYYNE